MQTLVEIHTHHVRGISGRAMPEDDYDALVAAYRDDVVAFLARCVSCVLEILEFSTVVVSTILTNYTPQFGSMIVFISLIQ